jgi:hypothetical protein
MERLLIRVVARGLKAHIPRNERVRKTASGDASAVQIVTLCIASKALQFQRDVARQI